MTKGQNHATAKTVVPETDANVVRTNRQSTVELGKEQTKSMEAVPSIDGRQTLD